MWNPAVKRETLIHIFEIGFNAAKVLNDQIYDWWIPVSVLFYNILLN